MNILRVLLNSNGALMVSLPSKPFINSYIKRFRKHLQCGECMTSVVKKPCFDPRRVTLEIGNQCHSEMIRSFLYTHYWPREPSIMALWMSLKSPYLEVMTDKYSNSGERLLAFERMERTNEKKLIGILVGNCVWPWKISELEEWAHCTYSEPERNRIYFSAHCLTAPNLFTKYNVPYIYDIEVLGTAAEVVGQGVATTLMRTALRNAGELRHPLVQVVAVSEYTAKVCERCGMKREWAIDYSDYVDDAGQRVFFPRRPHSTVVVYSKYYSPKICGRAPCKPPF